MMKKMIGYLAALLAGYGIVVGWVYFLQRSFIYFPDTARSEPAAFGVPDMSRVPLKTRDGLEIHSWYRPAADSRLPTLVYFHGNAGHLGLRGFKVRPYLDAGLGVLLVAWRGYGGNEGSPSEEGLMDDGHAAVSFLLNRGISFRDMVFYGESIGSGVAVSLAATFSRQGTPIGALILESPFTSLEDLARAHYPWLPVSWLLKDRFDNLSRIAAVQAPLLLLQGENDQITSPVHSRRLLDQASGTKELVLFADAGHNDLYDFGAAGSALRFLEKTFPLPGSRSQPPPR